MNIVNEIFSGVSSKYLLGLFSLRSALGQTSKGNVRKIQIFDFGGLAFHKHVIWGFYIIDGIKLC